MKKLLLTIIPAVFINGCASMAEVEVISDGRTHEVIDERKYMSCDVMFYQRGNDGSGRVYGNKYEAIANEVFVYSLMASNAYENSIQFKIPGWERLRRYENWNGIGLDVWENEDKSEIVVAYRGTDSLTDLLFGNFNIFWKGQYADAEYAMDILESEFKNKKIVATGHSLGGGLALHSSLYKGNVDAIVFNASPRIFNTNEYADNKSNRIIVSEKGEALNIFRENWPSLKNVTYKGPYNKFDFLDDFSVVEHGIYYIARGLTSVSASTKNTLAINVMENNMKCELNSLKSY